MPEINAGVPFSIWDGSTGDAFPTDDTIGGAKLVDGDVVFRSDLNVLYRYTGVAGVYTAI